MLFTGALFIGIFLIALTLTMLGLGGGGLIYSPLFALLGFEKSMVASTSLFLNLVAAASAVGIYMRRGMVDYGVALPLLLGGDLVAVLHLLPLAVLGVLLVFAGAQLALAVLDLTERADLFVALLILGITLASNLAAGFLAGIAAAYCLSWTGVRV